MVIIEVVKTKKDLKQFIDFPTDLYKDNPFFTPYIFEDELNNLNPKKNPASSYCDFKLFLDLKLYDIPNTVKGAVESVADLSPKFLTVHASGGSKMISAAAKALPKGSITAVTVLTSFSEEDFSLMGQKLNINETTKNWASNALSAGATSLVCSAFEVGQLRKLSNSAVLITPGVRVEGDDVGDQVRVMTPKDALSEGADFVVIGRSITGMWDGTDMKMRKKIEQIATTLG